MMRIGEKSLSLTNPRYANFPCMAEYDRMPAGKYLSFAFQNGPSSYQSKIVVTDRSGFRNSSYFDSFINSESSEFDGGVNLIFGGSTVFGVGSSDDGQTIPSYLHRMTGEPWINFGMRGAVSLQEYMHVILNIAKYRKINSIVFFSGVNDAYVNFMNESDKGIDHRFEEGSSSLIYYSPYRQILARTLGRITGVDPASIVDLP